MVFGLSQPCESGPAREWMVFPSLRLRLLCRFAPKGQAPRNHKGTTSRSLPLRPTQGRPTTREAHLVLGPSEQPHLSCRAPSRHLAADDDALPVGARSLRFGRDGDESRASSIKNRSALSVFGALCGKSETVFTRIEVSRLLSIAIYRRYSTALIAFSTDCRSISKLS